MNKFKKYDRFNFLNRKKFKKLNIKDQQIYIKERIEKILDSKLNQLVVTYDLYPQEIPSNLLEDIKNKNIEVYFEEEKNYIKPILNQYNFSEELLDHNIGYDYLGFFNLKNLLK